MIIKFQIGFFLEPIIYNIEIEETEVIYNKVKIKPIIKQFKRKIYIPNIHKKTDFKIKTKINNYKNKSK